MDYFHTSDSSQLSGTNPFTRPNEFEFDPDPINWGHGTEAAEADAYSSTLLDDNALFQTTSHAETPLPRPQLPIGWDDLTVGSQWITLKILCDSGLNKKARVKQGFSSIVTANLRLSRVQIQRFLAKYMEQYEAWAHWKETSSNIAWDKLLECAANANMSVMDLLPQDRPQLSTDRISREEVDAAAKFLQSKHLDQYAGKLSEWVGINVHGDFLGLRIESELLRDHLDWKLLKKAHELGWIDMEVLEKKYEDVCQRDGRTDRVPREVFSFFRGDNTQAAGVPSIGPSSSNGTQAKRSRKKATTSDDNTTGNSGENANKSKARCSDGPCLNENSSPVQRPSNKELAEPKARDTVILSESPNTASLQPPSTTEDKSGALNTRGSIVQASNKLSEASVGNLSNGYRSLKAGVVNDSAILNSSVSKITQNSPHHDNSHKDGPSTNATAVTSTPDREGVAAPTGRGSRTRAQGAEGCDTTASSQLREALDTRYAGYLDTPVSSSKLPRRERKPSRRARDGRSHPDFPTSDTDDGDYAPGRERVHQRKRIRLFSKRYESNSDEEDTPYEDKGQKQPRARRATVSSNARASKRERGQRPAERKTKKEAARADVSLEHKTRPGPKRPSRELEAVFATGSLRNSQTIFGEYRHRVLNTQPGRLNTTEFAWSASHSNFAATAERARYALIADRVVGGKENDEPDEGVWKLMDKLRIKFQKTEQAAQADVGPDAENASFAGCADKAVYALDAKEAEFALEIRQVEVERVESVNSEEDECAKITSAQEDADHEGSLDHHDGHDTAMSSI